jgi:tRNA(adenine34) deaminase
MKPSPHMERALAEAEAAQARGEVPIGAVLVDTTGALVAADGNRVIEQHDPTAHAEMLVLRAAAAKLSSERLSHLDLYVTLEPCAMCAAALALARIRRIVYGAPDPKGGGVDHGARIFQQATTHHRPEVVSGVGEGRAAELLRTFFQARR